MHFSPAVASTVFMMTTSLPLETGDELNWTGDRQNGRGMRGHRGPENENEAPERKENQEDEGDHFV